MWMCQHHSITIQIIISVRIKQYKYYNYCTEVSLLVIYIYIRSEKCMEEGTYLKNTYNFFLLYLAKFFLE
jgi:hypothetical protein